MGWLKRKRSVARLLRRLLGHKWRWKWDGGKYEYTWCARCTKRWDERAG